MGNLCPYLKIPRELTLEEKMEGSISREDFEKVILRVASAGGRDWNKIARVAVSMYLTGKYTQEEVAKYFGLETNQLLRWVDLKGARMLLQGRLANKAYQKALKGDNDMLKFVLDRQAGWNRKTEVAHGGEIGLRPILNIGLKQLKKPDIEV